MAIEEEIEQHKEQLSACSTGETLTFDVINGLARIAAAGGRVGINGVPMTADELLLFAEAARQGFTFCLIRQKGGDQVRSYKNITTWSIHL